MVIAVYLAHSHPSACQPFACQNELKSFCCQLAFDITDTCLQVVATRMMYDLLSQVFFTAKRCIVQPTALLKELVGQLLQLQESIISEFTLRIAQFFAISIFSGLEDERLIVIIEHSHVYTEYRHCHRQQLIRPVTKIARTMKPHSEVGQLS